VARGETFHRRCRRGLRRSGLGQHPHRSPWFRPQFRRWDAARRLHPPGARRSHRRDDLPRELCRRSRHRLRDTASVSRERDRPPGRRRHLARRPRGLRELSQVHSRLHTAAGRTRVPRGSTDLRSTRRAPAPLDRAGRDALSRDQPPRCWRRRLASWRRSRLRARDRPTSARVGRLLREPTVPVARQHGRAPTRGASLSRSRDGVHAPADRHP
jgi:hypothetical protein